jgi:hypothetical protein
MAIIVTPENREDIAQALAALAGAGKKQGRRKPAAQASKPNDQASAQGAK